MQKVLFVISNNPFSKDRKTILKLLEELLLLNAQLEVYLHGNGVWWLGLDDLRKLTEKGVKVYCARHSVIKRNQAVSPWATEMDIDLLAEKIVESDKVLFFN